MSGEEHVRDAIDAINRGDVDGLLERIDADFEWTVLDASPLAGTYRGHEEVRRYVQEWIDTFDGVRLEIEELVKLDEHVLAVIRGSGWGKASGVEVSNRFCQLWALSGDAPTRMREYATREGALAAAGADRDAEAAE